MPASYEIIDGVRRAKAAQLSGHSVIAARLMTPDGARLIDEFEVDLDVLHSPHQDRIERITPYDEIRWKKVERGAQNTPLPFLPIAINKGRRGVRLEEVTFDFGAVP
jgi:hypothetical protein